MMWQCGYHFYQSSTVTSESPCLPIIKFWCFLFCSALSLPHSLFLSLSLSVSLSLLCCGSPFSLHCYWVYLSVWVSESKYNQQHSRHSRTKGSTTDATTDATRHELAVPHTQDLNSKWLESWRYLYHAAHTGTLQNSPQRYALLQ